MRKATIIPLLLLAAPASAQSSASEAARKFSLDPSVLQADDNVTIAKPAEGPPATVADEDRMAAEAAATVPPTAPQASGPLTLDTPIAELIGDTHGRAVLDRDLPGLSTDPNLDKFAAKSLRQFQPLTGGQLTDAMLAKVAKDLGAPGPAVAPPSSTRVDRRRDER